MRNNALTAIAVVGASVVPATALGGPTDKPVIVLESHVGSRPAKLAPFLRAVNDQLETRGYAAFPASVMRLAGNDLPRSGILDPDLTAAGLAELHSSAFAKYKAAQCGEALPQLIEARDKTRRNPALVANDIGNHDLMFRTLVAIADCHKRLGDEKSARTAMKEVRRVYPTRPVSRADAWGPSGEELYMTAMLDERGVMRGRLTIGAGDANAQIAVEGQLRGIGNVSLGDLLPGVYRVFIRTSARDPGRQYDVMVKPGDETRLKVDINRDELLHASEDYVALTYPSESARKDECKVATHFAERWTESGATIVLASGEENGRPVIVGMRCRDGEQVRRATIFTDTDEATTPEKLVPFLDDITTDDTRAVTRKVTKQPSYTVPALVTGGGLVATIVGAALELRKERPNPGQVVEQPQYLASYPGLSIRIAGGVATATGLYLLMRNHEGTRRPSTSSKWLVLSGSLVMIGSVAYHIAAPVNDRDEIASRVYTVGGFVAGSMALGGGVYKWLRDTRDTSRFSAGALGFGAAAALSAGFLLVADEDPEDTHTLGPRAEYGVRRNYWDTGIPGAITGGAAVVAIGIGIWGASHSSTSTPIATIDGESTMVGWAGTF